MEYRDFICPYELALKLHELGVNLESEFYFVKEIEKRESNTVLIILKMMKYIYNNEIIFKFIGLLLGIVGSLLLFGGGLVVYIFKRHGIKTRFFHCNTC